MIKAKPTQISNTYLYIQANPSYNYKQHKTPIYTQTHIKKKHMDSLKSQNHLKWTQKPETTILKVKKQTQNPLA